MSDAPKNRDLPGLYNAVGEAISAWSVVEARLYHLFCFSLTLVIRQPGGGWSYSDTQTSSILDAIEGFRGKLLMIDAALIGALTRLDAEADAILNDWAVERKKVGKLSGNRNALARWRAVQIPKPDGTVHKFVIQSPRQIHKEGATETDIRCWTESFAQASERLSGLEERVVSHRGHQRRFLQRVASQVACCLPADTMPLEFLKHELSGRL